MQLPRTRELVPRLAIVLFLSLLALTCGARAEDWPRWKGARGDGTWSAPELPARWPAEGLAPVWKQPIGPGYSGISVADGRVYTMDRAKAAAEGRTTDGSERVLCWDAATGKPLWQFAYDADYKGLDYDKGPRCTPTVADGRVYTLGAVGHLHCLDAKTGSVLWSKDFVKDHGAELPMWGFSCSPVIDGTLVIVHAGLKPGGCYVAYDRITGEEVWRGGDDPLGYGTPIVIEHNGTRQLIGWTPENVVSLRISDGKPLWKVPYKVTYGVSIATPVFHEGIVLVCGYWEGSKAIKLGSRPEDAEILWEENRFLRGLMDPPLYRDGHGYLLDKQHGIVGFKWSDGQKLWTDENRLTPRGRNPQASLVWLGDSDRAIALNSLGELILVRLTPAGLEEQSRAKIVGETWAHPAYAGNHAFARDDNQIVCVKLTGK